MNSPELNAILDGPELAEILAMCDCSVSEFLPCEDHMLVLAQRDGASLRTGDELNLVFISDAQDIDPDCLTPYSRGVIEECERDLFVSGERWLTDSDLADELGEITRQVESYISGVAYVNWNDGYVIFEVTGGPLNEL